MKIKVDKEGMNAIQQMVDIVLKQGGIKNLNAINEILASCEVEEDKKEKE